MSQIENQAQLRAEIIRLKAIARQQEQEIKNDIRSIKENFQPENIFWNLVSSLTGMKMNKGEFFKDGIAFGLSLFLQRFVLKTEKKMENKIYDFIDSIFGRIKNVVNKFAGAEAKRSERKEAEEGVPNSDY